MRAIANTIIAAAGPLILSLSGCLTVNIVFPAKPIEKAAEAIVDEARPPAEPSPAESSNPGPEGKPSADGTKEAAPAARGSASGPAPAEAPGAAPVPKGAWAARREAPFLLVAFPVPATADEEVKIDIETPVIKSIRQSLRKRFERLRPFYQKGAVGESLQGYLEAREEGGLSLKEKKDLKSLIEEENQDRKNLYQELVKANKLPDEALKKIQGVFAREWIGKCRPGWWIQNEKGEWVKKEPPKKEEKKKGAASL